MVSGEHRCGVYAIQHIESGRSYIGSSYNIPSRWYQHRAALKRNRHHSDYLQNAWNKYGESAFRFYVLEDCTRDELPAKEREYVETFDPAFNVCSNPYWAFAHNDVCSERARVAARARGDRTTHCPQGHEYTPERTYVTSKNQRVCLECARIKSNERYQHTTPFTLNGPVCRQGHEWTPENTITLKSGTRQCRACKQQRIDTRNERNRIRYETDPAFRERSRLDYELHKTERLAQQSEHGFEVRRKNREERIARGEKPGTLPACRKAGHPWTPETTVYKGKVRLCKICRDATRASESPEAHAARLARRRELESAGRHDANQRAYAKRKARLTASH